MDFINNTGHIFSLPSYKEKPIGYEYEEYSYIFWFESLNASKLSIKNCYIKPIYALYDITDIKDKIENYKNNNGELPLSIEIYFDKSNVYSLVSPIGMQDAINSAKNLHEYVKINNLDEKGTTFITDKLTENDIYAIQTWEQVNESNKFDYLLIPIYVLANASEEGAWISNLMIHITNNDSSEEEWCYISVGGEFVDEYEGLLINGTNMGVNLPKDILKSINKESLYNDEFNASLYNDKLKEYLLNYMGIRGEMGNFNSAIKSLKWFGYGNKLSISKLLKTDNEFMNQYLLDYFDISYDILNAFKKFKSDSLIALRLMTNGETGEWHEFNTDEFLFGENNPVLEEYFDKYIKVKIGNHDMPIEDDDEKYWYWKPYFDFSFFELGIKLSLLAYYYNKYFLPIHLNIHSATLGYKVYANDIKMNMISNWNFAEPLIMLNGKNEEVEFPNSHLHYFTKQIHIVDDNYNEFNYDEETINNVDLFEINDTCLSIPIKFKENKFYNCILVLKKIKDHHSTYEYILDDKIQFGENLIIKSKDKTYDLNKLMFAYAFDNKYSTYFNGYDKMNEAIMNSCMQYVNVDLIIDYINENIYETNDLLYELNNNIYVISYELKQDILNENVESPVYMPVVPKNISIKIKTTFKDIIYINNYEFNKFIISNDQILYKRNFSFIQDKKHQYENFVIYPKHLNISLKDDRTTYESNIYDYWVNRDFTIDLLVNNKWYSYDFKTKIDMPILDFGVLNYRYYLNDNNYLLWKMIKNKNEDHKKGIHSIIFQDVKDSVDWYALFDNLRHNESFNSSNDIAILNDRLYDFINTPIGYNKGDLSFIRTLDLSNIDSLWQYYFNNYNIISNFAQIRDITPNGVRFNSFMHNKDLAISNNINYDINFKDILESHLESNLLYIDASLLNNEFYQYFIYNDTTIIIHKDIVGKNFSFNRQLLETHHIINIYNYENTSYAFIDTENIDAFRIYENSISIDVIDSHIYFIWDSINNCYSLKDHEDQKYYMNDKLNNKIDLSKFYVNNIYLPQNNKYLNSIHMYGLYKNVDIYHNILVFHNDIDMTVNGLNFTHNKFDIKFEDKNDYESKQDILSLRFNITGTTERDLIDSRYPDIYGLRWNDYEWNEDAYALELYGIYLKSYLESENNYKVITPYQFTNDDFHYEELPNIDDNLICIGYVIYDTMNEFNTNDISEKHFLDGYEDSELFIENDEYWFYNPQLPDLKEFNKKLKTKLLWKISFIDQDGNEYDPSVENIIHNEYNIKATFYYYKLQLIRNKFITLKQLSKEGYNVIVNREDETATIDGLEITPIKRKNGYLYTDKYTGEELRIQNPSMYWYNADELNYEKLDNALNELIRYWFNEDDTVDTIVDHFDKYIIKELSGNDHNEEELRYTYRNYLSKDLTGQEGDFILTWNSNIDEFKLCICIERIDGSIETYYNKNDEFTLYGDEKHVTAYFTLRSQLLTDIDAWIEPQLIKVIHHLERITYDPTLHTNNNPITIEFNNKEYKYGDNDCMMTSNLYEEFFELKYNIWHVDHQDLNDVQKLYSIYDAKDEIKLKYNKLDYDLYLMHDNEYWYCIYISKQTCEEIWDDNDLVIPNELKKFVLPSNEFNYYLVHEKSSKEFLINRFEYISKRGKNQFKYDDIICGRIMNNDRLPYNPFISAKWKISPMSIGMNVDSEFTSNSEISILSLPKNDNKHQKGYYKVTVRYSLDRDVQHQFKNTSTIKIL